MVWGLGEFLENVKVMSPVPLRDADEGRKVVGFGTRPCATPLQRKP